MGDPGLARFRALASRGNVVPVWRELASDCLTPVMAMLGAKGARRAFLLESVEGGERIARYSFTGRDPWLAITAVGGGLVESTPRGRRRRPGAILDALAERFARLSPVAVEGLPRFTGGAVGWISWGALEPEAGKAGPFPAAWFGFYDSILAFDHLRQSVLLLTSARTEEDGRGLAAQYRDAQRRLDRLQRQLRPARSAARELHEVEPGERSGGTTGLRAGVGPARWRGMVQRARAHIRAGDVYQVVLSRRFEGRLTVDPFQVYRALRRINPSPYMFFLRDGATAMAGASPEMLLRVEGRSAELHPIAGTRPRGGDAAEDRRLEEELLRDEKERAEHVMLVDLGRNDLGRVCAPGSVSVPEFLSVQRFSHVMHLVSRVTGTLAPGRTAFDALRSVFPAGTVSGAPKVRAMQIIGDLESAPRGPYAGAVCYLDYSGNLDSCIIIRTLCASGRRAWVQAGAGIVADSDPDREFQETASKAGAVMAAVRGARAWRR